MRKASCPGGARILGCALVTIVGCSGSRVVVPGAESSSGEPSTSTSSGSSSTTLASSSSTGLADDTTGTASTSEPEVIFLPEVDLGSGSLECDLFAQDCPPGEKCMPWAPNGGDAWHGWGCKPIADDPVGIDEVCHVQGGSATGIDDCELGAMCWDVDPKTNQGTCIPLCVNTPDDPLCDDPQRRCQPGSDNILWLCQPICDPVAQDCPAGQGCYYTISVDLWQCTLDASGPAGAHGDACTYVNVCDPGLVCLEDFPVPPGLPCEGEIGCCTEVCDLDDPLGDMQCTGADLGQICQPLYEEGMVPPDYEHVGVCVLPR